VSTFRQSVASLSISPRIRNDYWKSARQQPTLMLTLTLTLALALALALTLTLTLTLPH
jgi:hypothetical protein